MAFWTTIDGIADGNAFNSDLLNSPLNQVRERTDWLHDKLIALSGRGGFEAVVFSDMLLLTASDGPQYASLVPSIRDVVVYNKVTGKFGKALYKHGIGDSGLYELDSSAYAVGVLVGVDTAAATGSILFSGRLELSTDGTGWDMSTMLESGQVFEQGPYYLSAKEPGKLTLNVGQRAIYVGYFTGANSVGSYAMVSPQYRDYLLGHSHSSFLLHPRTAGFHVSTLDVATYKSRVLGYAPEYYRGDGTIVPLNADIAKFYGTGFTVSSDINTYVSITTTGPAISWPSTMADGDSGVLVFAIENPNAGGGKVFPIADYSAPQDYTSLQINGAVSSHLVTGDRLLFGRNRLQLGGTWYGSGATVYTLTLGTSVGPTDIPLTFDDCYLYWTVNNGTLPEGRVRMIGYNVPTYIGIRHDGVSTNAGYSRVSLADSTARWIPDRLIGLTISNLTDGSSGIVVGNTANTVTVAHLVGGTRNTFQLGDLYSITGLSDSGLYAILRDNLQILATSDDKWSKYVTERFSSTNLGALAGAVQDTVASRYRWVLSIPEELKGWSGRSWNQLFTPAVAEPSKARYNYSMVLYNTGTVYPAKPFDTFTVEMAQLICYGDAPKQFADGSTFTLTATIDNIRQERKFKVSKTGLPEAGWTIIPDNGAVSNIWALYDALAAIPEVVRPLHYSDDDSIQKGVTFICSPGVESIVWTYIAGGGKPTISPSTRFNQSLGKATTDIGCSQGTALVFYDEDMVPLYQASYSTIGVAVVALLNDNVPGTVLLTNNFRISLLPYSPLGVAYAADTDNPSPTYGDKWTVDMADESLVWVSSGNAYTSADLQYNVGCDPNLNAAYPPVPLTASVLVRGGVSQLSVDEAPDSPASIFRAGLQGIYWYTRRSDLLPLPSTWVDSGPSLVPTDDGTTTTKLAFLNINLGNSTVVSSLQPVAGSAVKVVRCGTGVPATTGDLAIDVDLNLQVQDAGTAGAYVVKQASGLTLSRGLVVEKIVSTDGSISVTPTGGQGTVDISTNVSQGSGDVRGWADDIMLLNAKQDLVGLFPYIKVLPLATALSGFIAKFRAPYTMTTLKNGYTALYYISMFPDGLVGTQPTDYIGLTVSYSILPDYSSTYSDPTVVSSTLAIPYKSVDAKDPIVVTNDLSGGIVNGVAPLSIVGINPGYVVAIKVVRATPTVPTPATDTVYVGNLGVLDIAWALRPTPSTP